MKSVIHWFRRDLRITDNSALNAASALSDQVVPVYVVSDWRANHRWTGSNRQSFLCGCLASLAQSLKEIGGSLVIRQGDAVEALEALALESRAEAIFFNRDPDPFGREIERRIQKMAASHGIAVHAVKDVCVHERDDVLTGAGESYRVFTPYSKAWAKLPRPLVAGRLKSLRTPGGIKSLPLPTIRSWALKSPPSSIPGIVEPGERAARARMDELLANRLAGYGAGRDLPAAGATSRLSQDLRFGLLSIRELIQACEARSENLPAPGRDSAGKFLSELIWREFYMQILWHFPEVLDSEFNPVFRGMEWPGRTANFARWCAGDTGFPIVDAAMRELNATGFMHNRARMISAMFLTKDLHLDWRLGESYFMQKLVDGEIASNNGGWQWSAGTGADAAPYFRIQNPWAQTKRYDPQAAYIKAWLPELQDVAPERLCQQPAPGCRLAKNYPAPVVDHAAAREVTLDLFAGVRRRPGSR